MSLCFLVEGDQTEKRVYRAWVAHLFPSLTRVTSIGEMTAASYCIISGGGIPLYLEQIHDVLLAIKENPSVDHLFICIDAEDLTYLQEMLREQGKSYTKTNPGVVLEKNYLDALHLRCTTTGHLPSLQRLFATWSALAAPASALPDRP